MLEYKQEYLKSIFEYNDGYLYWRHDRSDAIKAGRLAGSICKATGYHVVKFGGSIYSVHRIIWTILNGEIPYGMQIDHINMQRADNRIENLRLATPSQNRSNSLTPITNTSGIKGVRNRSGRWTAEIRINKKIVHLGSFKTAEEAASAYSKAAIDTHGVFARTQ